MSLLHQPHPWIGRTVTDTATGRRGTLRAVAPEPRSVQPVAWLHPHGGGPEWTTDLDALTDPAPITPDTTPRRRTAGGAGGALRPGGAGGRPGSSQPLAAR
ncbi:hypothetical protein AB0D90_03760 [Streptomyces althioticus]|uniref:hypothetical protein n=1 Tax=Streptomyces althioticus TaxID=83380 RepID=UPI0033D23328